MFFHCLPIIISSVVRFVLLSVSPLVGPVLGFVMPNISPLVGSVVRFVLHLKPVRYCPTFLRMSFVCPHSPSIIQRLVFWARVFALRPQQSGIYGGVSLGRSGRVFINGSLGWSTYWSDVFVLQRLLGLLLKKNGRHCL